MTVVEKVQSKVPRLRFPEFNGAWEENNLGSVSKNVMYGAGAAATEYDGTNGYIRITDIDDESRDFLDVKISSPEGEWDDKYILKEGDLVFARTGASTGKCYKYKKPDGRLFFAGFLIKAGLDESYIDFVYQNTFRPSYWRWISVMSVRSGQPGINAEELKSYKFNAPKEVERKKISRLLISVDKKTSLLKQKHEQLEQYKKGIMQQLFSQQLRFKDDDGQDFPDWKQVHLNEVATPIKRKAEKAIENVMTISAGKGFLHQKERFSQVIAGTSLDKYTLIKEGEFSYNRGNSKSYTYGCIYKLSGDKEALVPFIYRSFKLKAGVADFYAHLFEGKYLDRQLRRLISSSARMDGLLNIGEKDFYKVTVPYPCDDEQEKIAALITSLNQKINLAQQQIEQTQTYKQGLLQQMFV